MSVPVSDRDPDPECLLCSSTTGIHISNPDRDRRGCPQKYSKTLCRLLNVPLPLTLEFQQKCLNESSITFCEYCVQLLELVESIFEQLEQLEAQLTESRINVQQKINSNSDCTRQIKSSAIGKLRIEISRAIALNTNAEAEDVENIDDNYGHRDGQANESIITTCEVKDENEEPFININHLSPDDFDLDPGLDDDPLDPSNDIPGVPAPETNLNFQIPKVMLERVDEKKIQKWKNGKGNVKKEKSAQKTKKSTNLRRTKINPEKPKIIRKRWEFKKYFMECTVEGCTEKFDSRLIAHHLKKCHGDKDLSMKVFQCPHCPVKCPTFGNFQGHVRIHTGEKPFVCEHCNSRFRLKRNLTNHITNIHSGPRPFPCPEEGCGKSFAKLKLLKLHEKTHSGTRDFMCELCPKTFTAKYCLQTHQVQAHWKELNLERFICKFCDKIMATKPSLQYHEKLHTGDLRFQCHLCPFRCNGKSSLAQHLECHERAYACTYSGCEKTFKHERELVIHLRSHTGEKPFKCKYCPKSFISSQRLRIHEPLHLGGKDHACLKCGDEFPIRLYLSRHLKTCGTKRKYTKYTKVPKVVDSTSAALVPKE